MRKILLVIISLLMVVSTQAQKVVENDSLYTDTRYGELLVPQGQVTDMLMLMVGHKGV